MGAKDFDRLSRPRLGSSMSVDLVPAPADDALEVAALFTKSWRAMSRIHNEIDLDRFEVRNVAPKAKRSEPHAAPNPQLD